MYNAKSIVNYTATTSLIHLNERIMNNLMSSAKRYCGNYSSVKTS